MNKFSWLEIDGIRYDSHDGYVVCHTDVGFSSTMPGCQLEALDVSDSSGKTIGYLSVDFANSSLQFSSCVPHQELGEESIRIGYQEYVENQSLRDLVIVPDYNSILDDGDQWLPVNCDDNYEPIMAIPSLECLVSPSDETLDLFFGASYDAETNSNMVETPSTPYSADLVAVYLEHGIEASLMPMLQDPIDLSNII